MSLDELAGGAELDAALLLVVVLEEQVRHRSLHDPLTGLPNRTRSPRCWSATASSSATATSSRGLQDHGAPRAELVGVRRLFSRLRQVLLETADARRAP